MAEVRKNSGIFTLIYDSSTELDFSCTEKKESDYVSLYEITMTWDANKVFPTSKFTLHTSIPMKTAKFRWTPPSNQIKNMPVIWSSQYAALHTNLAIDCPVICGLDESDNSIFTIALSDAKKDIVVRSGAQEFFEGPFDINIIIPFSQLTGLTQYTLTVRIDNQKRYFAESLDDVRLWWEKLYNITPMPVPDCARKPFYSTWYSYHKDLTAESIERECANAKQLSMDAIILDDGWQTSKVDLGGYATTGDWNVCEEKFPDFAKHVENVHKLGMKYLVWFSVPFIGEKSQIWETFKDKTLNRETGMGARILDPRYPEVREYLINKYTDFALKYKIDGFKLDFIDMFHTDTDIIKEGFDIENLYDAVEVLMTEVKQKLSTILPEPMIEFRQHYTGPIIRKFGNMLRVADCPYDGISNRIGIADIRYLAGNSAVHSDMIMWNPDIPVEDAAWQILNSIFGVIQYSMKIENLPDDHKAMSKFWLDFSYRHINTLQCSHFRAYEPHASYPVISAYNNDECITAVYNSNKIVKPADAKTVYIINAADSENIYIDAKAAKVSAKIYDCCGSIVEETIFSLVDGVNTIKTPRCGLLEMTKL